VTATPKRYRFDNPGPTFEPRPLPVRRPETSVAQTATQLPEPAQQYAQPQVVHIHQAPPDRTLQRLALGAGMGGGAVATAVYMGPLLVASMEMVAITFLVGGLVIAVLAWSLVSVVRSINPPATGRKRRR
jgi:hypothetical protein